MYSPDFVEDTVGVLQLHSEDQIQGLWEINFILPIFMAPLYIIILHIIYGVQALVIGRYSL